MDDTATSTNSSADANNSTTTTTNQYYYTYGSTLYLYGFLAMLSLIFLVSVAVAWQGCRNRRALRARIDQAIARGVYDPGQPGADYLTFNGGRFQDSPGPTMNHIWLDTTPQDKNDLIVATGWDIKPTATAVIRPYTPPPPRNVRPPHPSVLLHDLFEPIHEYWFVRAVPEQPSQTETRPTNSGTPRITTTTTGNDLEKELNLSNALGLSVAVLIVMPNVANPTLHIRRGMNGKGKSVSRPNSSFSANSRSVVTHVDPAQGVASTSSPRESMTVWGVEEVHEKEELPDIVMGVAEVGLERPTFDPSLLEENREPGAVGTKTEK